MLDSFVILCALVILFLQDAQASLLEPRQRCVPTASVKGPCHHCVCTTEGLYHCRHHQCQENATDKNVAMEEECEPNRMYREETTFCTCSSDGFWRSGKCQEKFRNLRPKTALLNHVLRTNIACIPNTLYLIDCNICFCGPGRVIEVTACTNRFCSKGHKADNCRAGDILRLDNEICACSDIDYYIDRLCTAVNSRQIQMIEKTAIANIVDIGRSWRRVNDLKRNLCDLDATYTVDCNECICYEGRSLICTNKICKPVTRPRFLRTIELKPTNLHDVLPEVKTQTAVCIPGKMYRYKCNTCTCFSNRKLQCTTMICLSDLRLDLPSLRVVLQSTE